MLSLGLLLVGGVIFAGLGLMQTDKVGLPNGEPGSAKTLLNEIRKKTGEIQKKLTNKENLVVLEGAQDEHRVFVSSTLVYLPKIRSRSSLLIDK